MLVSPIPVYCFFVYVCFECKDGDPFLSFFLFFYFFNLLASLVLHAGSQIPQPGLATRPLHCREVLPICLSHLPPPTSMCLFFPSENLSFQEHQAMNHLLSPVLHLKQYQNTFTHNHFRSNPAKKSSGSF